jgi:hypothetical protein
MKKSLSILTVIVLFAVSCSKPEEETGPKLIFKFRFDSTQTRLNNFGQQVTVLPAGHSAQSPVFHSMSAHYIELAPDSLSPLGTGSILYRAAEVGSGSSLAIDFSKAIFAGNNEMFYSVPIKNITPGAYKWLRISLAYQNYDIKIKYLNDALPVANGTYDGNVASFVGFNTYLTSYTVKSQSLTVNGNRKQGYGAVELFNLPVGFPPQAPIQFQAPPNATTVPNPSWNTSPIPAGSCVVTGRFAQATGFTISGNETSDVVITVSLSVNKSFEWKDKNGDGLYQPLNAANNALVEDSVVDMGIRGLIPIVN